LSGPSLALSRKLEELFLGWAHSWHATEYAFPPFIAASDLARTDYFSSFQHLATFPVVLATDEASLVAFAAQNADVSHGVRLGPTASVEEVLTPAACYHVYAHLRDTTLREPCYVTTRGTCFRRERAYAALERQWSFGMREIVCVADVGVVKEFLAAMQGRLTRFFETLDLDVRFEPATDPFFGGARHPKHFAQQIDPVKLEMVLDGRLAIGSLNFHRNYFGEAFSISYADKPAFSGCVAFGVERWIYAVASRYGSDPSRWPEPLAIARGLT
jgi:seryl-tRNA synthetase